MARGKPFAVSRRIFEGLVAEALEGLPAYFRERLDNVAIVVEEWPDRQTLRAVGVRFPHELTGYYHGTPQTARTSDYGLMPPDLISIYQRPIEMECRNLDELRDEVRTVVLHELAHHFGIEDNRLDELNAY